MRHNRNYMLISLTGLILSLAGAIIIVRYLHSELTVNHYVPELDRTIVVCDEWKGALQNTSMINYNNESIFPTPHKDKDVEAYSQFYLLSDTYISSEHTAMPLNLVVSDTSFFSIFPRSMGVGRSPTYNFEAVVTPHTAARLWPGENPIGKAVSLHGAKDSYTVVGVVNPMPTKGHFDFDILFARSSINDFMCNRIGWLVLRVRPSACADSIEARANRTVEDMDNIDSPSSFVHKSTLLPLDRLYFDSSFARYDGDKLTPGGNLHNLRILLIVAVLLLLVGLFNFLNIYSIVMIARGSAFAIRKCFGAGRTSIFMHILVENALVIILAVALAWAIVACVSPLLSHLFEIEQVPAIMFDILLSVGICVVFTLAVTCAASFSIWRHARVQSMGNSDSRQAIRLRRYLLLLPQMIITLSMITVSVYFLRQFLHLLNADMGYATENVLAFKLWPEQGQNRTILQSFSSEEEYQAYKNEITRMEGQVALAMDKIRQMPEVLAASASDEYPHPLLMFEHTVTNKIQKAGNAENEWIPVNILFLSPEEMDVYQIRPAEGSTFDKDRDDNIISISSYDAIVDRELLRRLGITDWQNEGIQTEHRMWWSMDHDCSGNPPFRIIGVIDDLRINPLTQEYLPIMILRQSNDRMGCPLIRYNPALKEQLLDKLTALYQEINNNDDTPEFEFSEMLTEHFYVKDKRTAHIYTAFALLAMFISCLGLYGVVAYDLQRRRREFTIRRVHGATLRDLTRLAARPYAMTLGIAVIIAGAVSLYAVSQYQSNYYDYVGMRPWGFIAGIAAIAVIGYVAIRNQLSILSKLERKND